MKPWLTLGPNVAAGAAAAWRGRTGAPLRSPEQIAHDESVGGVCVALDPGLWSRALSETPTSPAARRQDSNSKDESYDGSEPTLHHVVPLTLTTVSPSPIRSGDRPRLSSRRGDGRRSPVVLPGDVPSRHLLLWMSQIRQKMAFVVVRAP